MGDGSGIEWTDATWNPVVGCAHVSPGCDHCYAAREASGRLRGVPVYAGLATDGKFTGEVRCLPERLDQPLRWRKPRRVFVNSMSDLFHRDVPGQFLNAVMVTMASAHQHAFQVLTKRPQRMADYLTDLYSRSPAWGFYLRHVWWGTSIESDRYTWRADHLRRTPGAVRFLSLEPLLGPLPSLDLTHIDWVIVGGESGPGARPMHPGWVGDIRDRCVEAGVPFFFKQWGEWAPAGSMYDTSDRTHLVLPDGTDRGIPWGGWKLDRPEAEPMRRFGKVEAGRELDHRTWDEMPTGAPA